MYTFAMYYLARFFKETACDPEAGDGSVVSNPDDELNLFSMHLRLYYSELYNIIGK